MVSALQRKVPDSHVNFQDGVASVSCVCNGGLPFNIEPTKSALCKCGRLFVNIGRDEVRVCKTEEE